MERSRFARRNCLLGRFQMIGKLFFTVIVLACGPALAQPGPGLDPKDIGKAPVDMWTTYNGDYSGRRFSTLKQINQDSVKQLSLAWVYRLNFGEVGAITGGEGAAPVAA